MTTDNQINDARKWLEEKFGKIDKIGGSGSSRIVRKNTEVKKFDSKALAEI